MHSLTFHLQDPTSVPIELQQLIDAIPIGVSLIDESCMIIAINKALQVLTGFSSAEARGLPCYHVLRSALCVKQCPVRRKPEMPESVHEESDIVNKDRQRIPVNLSFTSLFNQNEKRVAFLETVEDLRLTGPFDPGGEHAFSFASLIGRSPQMERVYQVLPILAQSDSSVLITGETGTGKDLLAEALHKASNRSKAPFIKVNCGAVPENLLESELFGHQKGAFTGAVENKPGRFKLAHDGTLFLTEIGDLPQPLQVKLLTFLDDQVIYPLGSTKGFQANVRVIAGTHRNLEDMVAQGMFRRDLLFRLNVVRIHLPPLREREGDLQLLADHFRNALNSKLQKKVQGFSKSVMQLLSRYEFPGNVRELKNIVEYAINLCDGKRVEMDHLPAYLIESEASETREPKSLAVTEQQVSTVESFAGNSWADAEKRLILDTLRKTAGKKSAAANILGWGRSTLWRKMKKYGLN